jgi:hypothetical protein
MSYRHLTRDERNVLYIMQVRGHAPAEIAQHSGSDGSIERLSPPPKQPLPIHSQPPAHDGENLFGRQDRASAAKCHIHSRQSWHGLNPIKPSSRVNPIITQNSV